jgi:1-hydroxycarotenoid 3,4-desaturase
MQAQTTRPRKIVIIGAGVAGLTAALLLAARGLDVTVVEAAAAPGGKMREVMVGGQAIDAGPTVFTMRHVFEAIFAEAGASLDDHVTLKPLTVLARHAWDGERHLDLFADKARSAEAIGDFSGARSAREYLAFCEQSATTYRALLDSFMQVQKPGPVALMRSAGISALLATQPFSTMWGALGRAFSDAKLRQLFGRYATYCGSSPFAAPATLMLVAHVEQAGVWAIEGGMHKLALALEALARAKGARFIYGAAVAEIVVSGNRASGVKLARGDVLEADSVIMNGDAMALTDGLLGQAAARTIPRQRKANRSLSALTWHMAARATGLPLMRHNVFFNPDYKSEFADVFGKGRLPRSATVYLCAHDRGDNGLPARGGTERMTLLVNAPPRGDERDFNLAETQPCTLQALETLRRCGVEINYTPQDRALVTPADFHRLFPATGGALYGRTTHGALSSFMRPGSRTRLPGLYLAGGSVHPGPGVPMVALSGRLAAEAILADLPRRLASPPPSRPMAIPGGMSTR